MSDQPKVRKLILQLDAQENRWILDIMWGQKEESWMSVPGASLLDMLTALPNILANLADA